MSLIEENGGLGMIGIMSYFNQIPRAQRPRTLAFYFDCRHFMPGGEGSWPQFDYYNIHPEKLKPVVATLGMEHMGGRQTIETGPDGNRYAYSSERPEDGGVITSLIDVYNNNAWLIETVARAATDNNWIRVDVKAGEVAPGVNGGRQAQVRSPMNKGRGFKLPGIGLAGDWPGGWTQTYSQMDTEAGPMGFDKNYFRSQVGGPVPDRGRSDASRSQSHRSGLGRAQIRHRQTRRQVLPEGGCGQGSAPGPAGALCHRLPRGGSGRSGQIAGSAEKSFRQPALRHYPPDAGQKVAALIDTQLAKVG